MTGEDSPSPIARMSRGRFARECRHPSRTSVSGSKGWDLGALMTRLEPLVRYRRGSGLLRRRFRHIRQAVAVVVASEDLRLPLGRNHADIKYVPLTQFSIDAVVRDRFSCERLISGSGAVTVYATSHSLRDEESVTPPRGRISTNRGSSAESWSACRIIYITRESNFTFHCHDIWR